VTSQPADTAVLVLDQGSSGNPQLIQFSATGSGLSDAYVQLTGNNTLGWQATLEPYSDNNSNFTLGTASRRWRSIRIGTGASQFDGTLTVGGNLTANNGLTVGTLNGPLQANDGVVSATTSVGVLYGGTGLTSAPTYGQLLVGNSSGGYTLTATSSLGLATFAFPYTVNTGYNSTSTVIGFTSGGGEACVWVPH
jgi:hypothetical protein